MAVADYFDTVQKVYIAFYQRPADPAGLYYWSQRVDAENGNLSAVIDAFANSAEATRLFFPTAAEGETLYDLLTEENIGGVIDAIYLALFNRAPDEAGKQFYVDGFADGTFTAGNIMLNILNGAQGDDAVAVANKLEVASLFTTALDPEQDGIGPFQATYNAADEQVARDWLATVTSDPATRKTESEVVTDIQTAIADSGDAILGQTAGQTFTLTTGTDTRTGTMGNDTFVGVSDGVTSTTVGAGQPVTETFGGLDGLNGGAGTDALVLTNAVGTMTLDTSVSVAGIESLSLTSAKNDITADVQGWSGLKTVTIDDRGTGTMVDLDTKSNVTSVTITGTDVAGTNNDITDNGSAATTADVLASVSLIDVDTDSSDYTDINSDALTSVSLKNSGDVRVSAAAGTRALNVTLDDQTTTGGGVWDDTATTVNVTASGTKSSGTWLTTDAATTVTFAGDKSLSLSMSDTGVNAAVVTAITSTNTAGVTITSALGNTTAFTGGEGKDTITINSANTKATAMGAGDDKVNVSGTAFTTGTIDGGDGTDTIAFSAADAETLSAGTTYEAQISNFEKVGLDQVAAFATETVNLANLDDISYVVSAGTAAGTGQAEVATVTFNGLLSGQSVTVDGQTYTAASTMTAAQVASAFSSTLDIAGYTDSYTSGNTVTFTANAVGNDATNVAASVGQPAAPTAPSTNVTTQGVTGVTGVAEVFTVSFSGFATGADTIAFDGTTITLTDGDNANLIANAVAGGAYTNWTGVSNGNGTVTFTNKATGTVTDIQTTDFVVTNVGAVGMPTVSTVVTGTQGVTAVTAATEVTTMTFSGLRDGQSATVAGRTVTASGADLTATQVADAFEGGVNAGNAVVSGTLTGYTVTSPGTSNTNVQLTAAAAGEVADLVGSASLATAATAPTVSVVDGNTTAGGGALVLTNVANAGTVELTGANAGSVTVTMKDATGAADSVNLKLNGAANLAAGAVTVAGVESIAIVATDSSADDVTVTNPTAVSTLALNAAAATSITLSGNHGVDFTGSTFTKVTTLDASGVMANVNTTGLTAAQIVAANGVAGAVTFTSVVTDQDVTITTGNGNDVINASSVGTAASTTKAATISTGAGADTIWGGADADVINAGTERDTVYSSTGADSITLGAGNDVYVLDLAAESVLATFDTITDFSANTYGQGTSGAANTKGANTTVANLTGDTIDVSGLFSGGVTGIAVLVVTNAADAQTFIQNTGADSTNSTGFALDSTSGKLYMDFNQDGTVDSVVALTGVSTLTTAAFVTGL